MGARFDQERGAHFTAAEVTQGGRMSSTTTATTAASAPAAFAATPRDKTAPPAAAAAPAGSTADGEEIRLDEIPILLHDRSIEYQVPQGGNVWLYLRTRPVVTASRFGDVAGYGIGKVHDFYQTLLDGGLLSQDSAETLHGKTTESPLSPVKSPTSLLSPSSSKRRDVFAEHGIISEPIIDEVYQFLSGNKTTTAGFFVPLEGDPLFGLVGATPDGKVVDPTTGKMLGLVEYKAPVYKMYTADRYPHGIPPAYMCQMQGQMAISGCRTWCDFVAVCISTREITIKRVHFCPAYWELLSAYLYKFCTCLKAGIPSAQYKTLHPQTMCTLPAEAVTVETRITSNTADHTFTGDHGRPYSWSFLVGDESPSTPGPKVFKF